MLYAFVFSLAGDTLPFSILSLLHVPKYPGAFTYNLYHSGIATLTVGSIIRCVLDKLKRKGYEPTLEVTQANL